MKDLLDKLSSYNLFNYLLPGTVFVAIAGRLSSHKFSANNIVIDLFGYYFIGLVISRVGSLVLEPIMKRARFVRFAPYKDFLRASAQDSDLEMLSEQNNMFRTLCALFLAMPLFTLGDYLARRWMISRMTVAMAGCIGLFLLFAFAYRKQVAYIRRRVEAKTNV